MMEVEIISPTVQKFNGVSYYKCDNYYMRSGKRLHRVVWEYHYGTIPAGYHVHHKDKDTSNNEIENLMLVSASEHAHHHMSEPERVKASRQLIKIAIAKAPEWHSSKVGFEFHSKLAKNTWSKHSEMRKRKCCWCGKEYETRDLAHNRVDTYCCPNHKAAALRWRRKHEGSVNYPGRPGGCLQS